MATEEITDIRRDWLLDVRAFEAERVINDNTQRLLSSLREDDLDINRITRLLSLEPVLSAKILMICNSSFFGFPRQVTHIEEAIVILGALKLGNLVYSSLLMVTPTDAPHKSYIKHSLMTALFSRLVAEKVGLRSEVPFTAGLLHILPVIVNYRPNIRHFLTGPLLSDAVDEMLTNFHLPPDIISAANGLFVPDTNNLNAICLRMAFNLTVVAMGKDDAAFGHLVNVEHDFNRIKLKPREVADIIKESKLEQEELRKLLG